MTPREQRRRTILVAIALIAVGALVAFVVAMSMTTFYPPQFAPASLQRSALESGR